MKNSIKNLALVILSATAISSCGVSERTESKSETVVHEKINKETEIHSNTISEELTISDFTPHSLHKQAGFEQLSPKNGEKLKSGDIIFNFNTKKFPFVNGHSVKLAVENGTEKFIFEADKKVTLPKGTFLCAAYLCDENGISLKNSNSFQLTQLNIDSQESKEINLKQPMIFLNLPTSREGESILVDFMLFNTKLSKTGNKVRVSIDDNTEIYMDEWKTLKVKGLKKGNHKILVELINHESKLYDGVYANDNLDFEVQ